MQASNPNFGLTDPIDSFDRLAAYGKFVVLVFYNSATPAIELVRLEGITDPVETYRGFAARGFEYLALCGVVNGQREICFVRVPPVDVAFSIGAAVRVAVDDCALDKGLPSPFQAEPRYDWRARRYIAN